MPCLFLLIASPVYSKTFETLASGNWSDSSVWVNYEVPAYLISDSIVLKDSVRFDQNISLTGNSLMLIESGGGLCGHQTITVNTGTSLHNAGTLEVDSLIIAGGYYLNFGRGELLFKDVMIVTGGYNGGEGSAHFTDSSHGCGCYWEDCFVAAMHEYDGNPAYTYTEPASDCKAKAYPSIGDGNLKLEYDLFSSAWFTLYNTAGQLMDKRELKDPSGIESIHGEALANGLYLWEVRIGDHFCGRGKIIVTH